MFLSSFDSFFFILIFGSVGLAIGLLGLAVFFRVYMRLQWIQILLICTVWTFLAIQFTPTLCNHFQLFGNFPFLHVGYPSILFSVATVIVAVLIKRVGSHNTPPSA